MAKLGHLYHTLSGGSCTGVSGKDVGCRTLGTEQGRPHQDQAEQDGAAGKWYWLPHSSATVVAHTCHPSYLRLGAEIRSIKV
jgi:hypothetical protein